MEDIKHVSRSGSRSGYMEDVEPDWVSGNQWRGIWKMLHRSIYVLSLKAGSFDPFLYVFLVSWRLSVPYRDSAWWEEHPGGVAGYVLSHIVSRLFFNTDGKFFFGPSPILAVNRIYY